MTKKELIDMAKQSGARPSSNPDEYDVLKITDRSLEALAKLVAKREREACAKVCEDDNSNAGEWHWEAHVGGYFAKAIRARG
jgi:hypothetical protein